MNDEDFVVALRISQLKTIIAESVKSAIESMEKPEPEPDELKPPLEIRAFEATSPLEERRSSGQ